LLQLVIGIKPWAKEPFIMD